MPDDKACHEDNGWHIRQVVSFRPKRPFLEGHDRREETEDEKRRKTAEQSEKSSISPCPLALACYTILCVFGLIGIYLTTPPAAIDGDSDCKFGAALADALAHAEDPGRAEALSRILEDCIGSESEDDDE